MSILISAIICTYNRSHYLSDSIQSLVNQSLDKDLFEIIVVDNASTDKTKDQVCIDFSYVKNLIYVYEPQLGLSKARNTGWQKARGQYVAYIDDDATCAVDWLERIVRIFADHPEVGVVGGRVKPKWEVPPPEWLDKEMETWLSAIDWAEEPTLLSESQYLVGANIAYRSIFYERLGGFRLDLGRVGTNLVSSEETDFSNKIKSLGYNIFYDPGIVVDHLIPRERVTVRHFIRRAYSQGISDAIIRHQGAVDRFSFIDMCRTIKALVFSSVAMLIPGSFNLKFSNFLINLRSFACLVSLVRIR